MITRPDARGLRRMAGRLAMTALCLAAPARAQSADPDRLRAHTAALAHDLLEGRGTGTRGEELAALYISTRLRALGLLPLPGASDDLRIPVPLRAFRPDPATPSTLRIVAGDRTRTLRPPAFYHPGGPPAAFRGFAGDLIVGGPTPGALEALAHHPDLAGRVVLLGPPWTGVADVEAELARRGAEGIIEVVPDSFYHRLRVVRGPIRFALDRDPVPADPPAIPLLVTGPEGVRALGLSPAAFRDGGLPGPEGVDVRVVADLAFIAESRTGHNVAALLPAHDPDRTDDIVLVMAHYDHVGFGQPDGSDSIWNGFADNAAGVAVVLETARLLRQHGPGPAILFLFTTGEEQGLLGATAFADRPPVPLDRIRAVINIDGGAPPPDIRAWTVAAPEGSVLARRAARAIQDAGARVRTRPIRSDSDHWAFHRRAVPALFLYPDRQADGVRPHTPHDEWRPDFPFHGLALYTDMALAVIRAAADPSPSTPPD